MKGFKKMFMLILVAMLVAVPVYADDAPVSGAWAVFEGEVMAVPSGQFAGFIVNDDGTQATFMINDETVIVDQNGIISSSQIEIGDTIKVYYIVPEIMLGIYPPQYEAQAVVRVVGDSVVLVGEILFYSIDEQNGSITVSPFGNTVPLRWNVQERVSDMVLGTETVFRPSTTNMHMGEYVVVERKGYGIVLTTQIVDTDVDTLDLNFDTSVFVDVNNQLVEMENLEGRMIIAFADEGWELIRGVTRRDSRIIVLNQPETLQTTDDEPNFYENVRLTIDNKEMLVGNTAMEMTAAPYISQGRTMVPVHYVGYAFGQEITWNGETETVIIAADGETVEMVIGNTTMTINGEEFEMDVAPEITNDRTFLPIAWVAIAFGITEIIWDETHRTIEFSISSAQ